MNGDQRQGIVYNDENGEAQFAGPFGSTFHAKMTIKLLDPRADAEILPWIGAPAAARLRRELATL